jgi:hypothetical protein
MKAIHIVLALFALCACARAEFIETTAESAAAPRDTAMTAAPPAVPVTPVAAPPADLGRHHISLGLLGYFQASSGDFAIPEYDFDASQGQSVFMVYRYSFDRNLDVVADLRGWVSEAKLGTATVTTTIAGYGAGVRYTGGAIGGTAFPYLQASVLSIGETVAASASGLSLTASSEQGLGLAVNGGVEIRLGRLISIPVEAMYLYGKPADDVSGFGVTAGISFNWGRIE